MLTDAEIDGLSGRTLDEAVAIHVGWIHSCEGWIPPNRPFDYREARLCVYEYHTDLGAAVSLLIQQPYSTGVQIHDDGVSVMHRAVDDKGRMSVAVLARGPKSEAATVICRAYLKLVNRGT